MPSRMFYSTIYVSIQRCNKSVLTSSVSRVEIDADLSRLYIGDAFDTKHMVAEQLSSLYHLKDYRRNSFHLYIVSTIQREQFFRLYFISNVCEKTPFVAMSSQMLERRFLPSLCHPKYQKRYSCCLYFIFTIQRENFCRLYLFSTIREKKFFYLYIVTNIRKNTAFVSTSSLRLERKLLSTLCCFKCSRENPFRLQLPSTIQREKFFRLYVVPNTIENTHFVSNIQRESCFRLYIVTNVRETTLVVSSTSLIFQEKTSFVSISSQIFDRKHL